MLMPDGAGAAAAGVAAGAADLAGAAGVDGGVAVFCCAESRFMPTDFLPPKGRASAPAIRKADVIAIRMLAVMYFMMTSTFRNE